MTHDGPFTPSRPGPYGVPGARGYDEQADELISRYESVPFEHKYRAERHLLPASPVQVLDVGAGTGADAAWFAARGHRVVAVEPVARFREAGLALHPHPAIEWVDDSLPALSAVRAGSRTFGLILLSAVWMHLESRQREPGMERLGELLASDGVLILSLRHGPIPAGRCMFEVSANETIALASEQGLACVLDVHTESSQAVNRAAGVTWTRLAFKRATPRSPTGCSTIATHRSRRRR